PTSSHRSRSTTWSHTCAASSTTASTAARIHWPTGGCVVSTATTRPSATPGSSAPSGSASLPLRRDRLLAGPDPGVPQPAPRPSATPGSSAPSGSASLPLRRDRLLDGPDPGIPQPDATLRDQLALPEGVLVQQLLHLRVAVRAHEQQGTGGVGLLVGPGHHQR